MKRLLVALLVASGNASTVAQTIFELPDAITVVEGRAKPASGAASPVERLAFVLTNLLVRESDAARQPRPRISVRADGKALLVVGDKAQLGCVTDALGQLRTTPLPELRVQCTVLSVPFSFVRKHGLKRGLPKSITHADATAFIKDAVAGDGKLTSLPEAGALPLEAFVMMEPKSEKPGKRRKVEGQGLMLDPYNAAFTVRVAEVPADPSGPKLTPFVQAFRLRVGGGVLLTWTPGLRPKKGDAATVLWFRLASAKPPAEPKKTPG